MDFKKRFIDIEAGWPGSVGDSRVFALSYLNGIYEDYLSQFVPTPLATGEEADSIIYEDIPAFLLGDSAYANSRHLVTTFKVTECDRDEVIAMLNKRLGGARYHVENAFGILKARFQIFNRPLASGSEDLPFTVKLICAIFVLHNFLIDVQDESTEVDLNSIDDEGELGFGDSNNDVNVQRVAGTTRDALLRHLRSLNN